MIRCSLKNINSERFRNFCSGIQSIIIAIAVAIGGIWTVYTFKTQLHVENARAQLEKTQRENKQQISLHTTMKLEQINLSIDNKKHLSAVIEIENKGNRNVILGLQSTPFRVTDVYFNQDGRPRFGGTIDTFPYRIGDDGDVVPLISRKLFVDEKDSFSFVLQVQRVGLYLVSFGATARDEDNEFSIELSDSEYILIQ